MPSKLTLSSPDTSAGGFGCSVLYALIGCSSVRMWLTFLLGLSQWIWGPLQRWWNLQCVSPHSMELEDISPPVSYMQNLQPRSLSTLGKTH